MERAYWNASPHDCRAKWPQQRRISARAAAVIISAPRQSYFLSSALVRCSLVAVVRRVSGTFLLLVNFLRSMTLHIGSMCRETSIGVFGLFRRLRTTT